MNVWTHNEKAQRRINEKKNHKMGTKKKKEVEGDQKKNYNKQGNREEREGKRFQK